MTTDNDPMYIPNDIDERAIVFSDLQEQKQRGKPYKSTFMKHGETLSPIYSEFGCRYIVGETSSFNTREQSDLEFDARRE